MWWCARLLVLAWLPALTGRRGAGAGGEVVVAAGPRAAQAQAAPQFEEREPRDVIARLGHAATLECRVLHLHNKSVSWVRSRDLQILTYDGLVFTADSRVSVSSGAGTGTGAGTSTRAGTGSDAHTHALTIDRLRYSDAGRYECQLNTDPKMSLFFNLTVVDEAPPATSVVVLGAARVVGAARGAATLGCAARLHPAPRALPAPPLHVRWLHDGEPVDLQSSRGGVSLQTELWAARVESRLTLAALRREDSGLYTCLTGEDRADLHLIVREFAEEYPEDSAAEAEAEAEAVEAMQRDQTSRAGAAPRCPRAGAALLSAAAALLTLRPA